MTEEEAKTKWCPMVRSTGWGNDQMGNRDHKGSWTGGDCCVASECMMWRWDRVANPAHGYCGLAGRL